MPRKERQRKERTRSYRRIKGRKRKISTSSEEDEELWNTSLAVHETPSGESEEFLCPYFDGSKLILPPGYEDYKKKVEKDDEQLLSSYKGVFSDSPKTTPDGTPLRRSSRKTKTRKRMYIYSDDDSSSGFEDSRISSALASGAPIPTCMFVNAGVAGGSGIDVNKDIFKSLPQTKAQPATASQCPEHERIEFTIEINESSDEEGNSQGDGVGGTKTKKIIIQPEDGDDLNVSNINGLNQTKSDTVEATEPDIKVKDDPIFLSDDEVISTDSVKNGKETEPGEESKSSNEDSDLPSQEKSLEPLNNVSDMDDKQNDETKKDNLKDCNSGESVDQNEKDAGSTDNSLPTDAAGKNQSINTDNNPCTTGKDYSTDCTLEKELSLPKESLNSNKSDDESSTSDSEMESSQTFDTGGDSKADVDIRNENVCSENDSQAARADDTASVQTFDNETSNSNQTSDNKTCSGTTEYVPNENENNSDIQLNEPCAGKGVDSGTIVQVEETMSNSLLESKESSKKEEISSFVETEEGKSEEADSEKTEEFEPEAEHVLITEIKEKMKDYCSQRVEFAESLELSGNLTITADNEKPVRGSVAQAISKENSTTVENPVPTVCVPQELSNLVQKLCKEKLQYNVELLIQGELYATIDGTLVSTICNFSFEPEEDDF